MVKVLQSNIRSLNTSAKFVEDLIVKNNLNIISLTEIWHPDSANLKFLNKWTWYKTERKEQEGGGAALIVNPEVKSFPRKDLKNNNLEASWCEVIVEKKRVLIGSVYIPPGKQEDLKF